MNKLNKILLTALSACCLHNPQHAMQTPAQAQIAKTTASQLKLLQLKLRDAIFNDDPAAIKAALAAGANINTRYQDVSGHETTILAQSASMPSNAESVKSLRRVLAFPRLNINTPETPVILRTMTIYASAQAPSYYYGPYSAPNICLDALKALLEAGANVNGLANNGDTALHVAALSRGTTQHTEQVINLLLQYGADPEIPNNAGQTALDRAQANTKRPGLLKTIQDGRAAYLQTEEAIAARKKLAAERAPTIMEATALPLTLSRLIAGLSLEDKEVGARMQEERKHKKQVEAKAQGSGSGSGSGSAESAGSAGSGRGQKRKDRASEDDPEDTQDSGKCARKS